MYLLIVTGFSGAGKSLALSRLEEQGYLTVDNMPSSMLNEFISLCRNATPPIKKAAVTIDSRESLLSRTPDAILEALDNLDAPYEILFLVARDDILKKRYNELRRRHPLGDTGDAETGVVREHVYLQQMRDRANYVLDTSDIRSQDFYDLIAKVLPEFKSMEVALLFSSFGYKRGVPVDADIVLDMRFLPNPFYMPALRHLSGLQAPVNDFVLAQPYVETFFDTLENSLMAMLPLYIEQDKRIFRISFGCTGGRHRSVVAAEEMARRMSKCEWNIRVYHRDIGYEAADIHERFTAPN